MSEKLPVIHIPIKNGELVSSGSLCGSRGLFLHYTGTTDGADPCGPKTVAYEPRVGRCETCRQFKTWGECSNTGCPKPVDGSGFCDEHKPKL